MAGNVWGDLGIVEEGDPLYPRDRLLEQF